MQHLVVGILIGIWICLSVFLEKCKLIHVKGQTNQVSVSITLNTCVLFVLKS